MQEKKSAKNLRIRKVCIVGVIPSFAFQRAKYCALELHRKLPQRFPLPEIVGLLELDWSEKLQEWRQVLGREFWCLRRPVAVFFDNRFVGSDIELIKLTTISNILIDNIPRKDMTCLKQIFRKDYISYLKKSKRVYCYLDICVDDIYAGTLTFRLYSDLLPRTCENFKTLCLGTRGPLLSYKGSRIHRIVKKGWLQGGDIQYKTGGGGFSIFCDPLEDESYGISHDRRGVLSMANSGRHKNGSQFFVTLQSSTWMDTHFVAFGQLIEGAKLLKKLENLETFYERPINKVEIKNCGKLDLEDVEDIDALYKEEPLPPKKRKKIETITEQVVRMIMEALTEALQKKVRAPDILADGDVASKMNLQLYFQGFYSLPHEVLERMAEYLRNVRRELFRLMKPSATEIVESLMYDLQMAVFTRMTNLDEMRETIGRQTYDRMVSQIGMTLEGCKKSYVKRLINQIVKTAENMVELVIKKILMMKSQSQNLKNFHNRMQNWVRSFVLQETFEGDNYFIAERPYYPPKPPEEKPKEGNVCCEEERRKKERELKAKLKAKYPPEDLCCLGSQAHISDSEINLLEYFSTCRYDIKGKKPTKERMPLLDLIEISRFKLRWIRKQERRKKTPEVLCMEKKLRRWMDEVVYTPETSWLKDTVFPKNCRVLDHVEEVMYGAMTAGLLEMYFFMDQYLRVCGGKRKKLVTRIIYPEGTKSQSEGRGSGYSRQMSRDQKIRGRVRLPDERMRDSEEMEEMEGEDRYYLGTPLVGDQDQVDFKLIPCPCGHPCCDCPYKPIEKTERMYSEEREGEGVGRGGGGGGGGGEGGGGEKAEGDEKTREETEENKEGDRQLGSEAFDHTSEPDVKPCASDEIFVDIKDLLAQKLTTSAEKIDINSFKWMKPYILEQGCDLKTDFATRVHNWMEGELFNSSGLISKHSLATRASLLSLTLSLAELIKEENNVKSEIKDFIYDLWDLYFEEMFKEAALEFPPTEEEEEESEEEEKGEKKGRKGRRKGSKSEGDKQGKGHLEDEDSNSEDDDGGDGGTRKRGVMTADECSELKDMYPDFDLERFCKNLQSEEEEGSSEGKQDSQEGEVNVRASSRTSTPVRGSTPRSPSPKQSQTSRTSAPERTKDADTASRQSHASGTSVRNPQDRGVTPGTSSPVQSHTSEPSAQDQPQVTQPSESEKSTASRISAPDDTQPPKKVSMPQEVPFPQEEIPDEVALTDTEPQAEAPKVQPKKSKKHESEVSYMTETVEKRKSPIIVEELVDVPSGEEIREMPPYVPPFWLTFLTEMTKQALGAFARSSRLPRRLYLKSDSELAFDDKMKEWFEFNAFNPQPTKGREVMDFIALHRKSMTDVEDTVRSFMKKKKCSELINRCTRFTSADDVAGEIVAEAIRLSQENSKVSIKGEDDTVELFVSGLLSSAAAERGKSQSSLDEEEEEGDTLSVEADTDR